MSLGVLEARVKANPSDPGGFTAIASTGQIDRDGERIQPGALSWDGDNIPIHADHDLSVSKVVARGRPYYKGDNLMIEARFATTPDAQTIRQKVRDGVITAMSIVFRGVDWRDVKGVRTCVKGELFACDLVSVPSNPGARILSTRSITGRRLTADEVMLKARGEIAKLLADTELALTRVQTSGRRGPVRRYVDAEIRALAEPRPLEDEPVTFEGRQLTRHLYTY